MQLIRMFIQQQKIRLKISDSAPNVQEDRKVYSRPVQLFKGINNELSIAVSNADQKPVNISNYQIQVDLVSADAQDLLGRFSAEITDAAQGLADVQIPAWIINPAPTGWYRLLVRYADDAAGAQRPGFVNDNYQMSIPVQLQLGYRIPGEVYDDAENLDLGSLPDLVTEVRDLGAF